VNPNSLLELRVLTPEGAILESAHLTAVNVPLVDGGTIGIRPGHAPLIAETVKGPVTYRTSEGEEHIQLFAGVLDIRLNTVTILTAGEILDAQRVVAQASETEFNRLMQTLVKKLYPDQDPENN
jgi:F-type H+-transporting ATPase subunit epsilon